MRNCKFCGVEQGAENWVHSRGVPTGKVCKACFNKRQLAKLHKVDDPFKELIHPKTIHENFFKKYLETWSLADIPVYISTNIHVTDTECWEWTGKISVYGYGSIYLQKGSVIPRYDGVTIGVHRYMFEVTNNVELSSERLVCHRCDNPKCCNPAHLFEGSVQDNNADKVAKGRDRFVQVNKRGPHMLKAYWQEIKDKRTKGQTIKDLAVEYNCNVGTVRWIIYDFHLRN